MSLMLHPSGCLSAVYLRSGSQRPSRRRKNSTANGTSATPQHEFLIEGGRSRVEGNHACNNTGNGFNVTNTSSTNSVLVIGNSAGSNDLGEFSIGAGNSAGLIIGPSAAATNTIPTANFNL